MILGRKEDVHAIVLWVIAVCINASDSLLPVGSGLPFFSAQDQLEIEMEIS